MELLAQRFTTGMHRPRYGVDPATVLRDQRARRGDAFASVADLTVRDAALPFAFVADEIETSIALPLLTKE